VTGPALQARQAAAHDGPRAWVASRVGLLEREAARSADTHLLLLELPALPGVRFYLKDETTHPSGSLKHRLARSLYLYALCNGRLGPGQAVIDASSGSTAISEAWFARLLDLHFTAVMPECTAPAKVREIRALGAECLLVSTGADCAAVAQEQARRSGACFLDQFGLAERATDWRGNNNIAESLLAQLAREPQPVPDWIVCGAGTGGTSATIGRYLRYRRLPTRLCVAEPAGRAFALGHGRGDRSVRARNDTLVEGVGRPTVEPGFLFEVVDAVEEVADADAVAGAWLLESLLGRRYGGSSGVNLVACLSLAAALRAAGRGGSIVTVLGDRGERYAETLFDPAWLARRGIALVPALETLCQRAGLPLPRPGD
jgi:cysteine synthase A